MFGPFLGVHGGETDTATCGRQLMRGGPLPLAATFALAAACGSPAGPFTDGPAHASVTGVVVDAGGLPVPGTTIRIACGGGADPLSVAADSAGRYLANLETDSDPFSGSGGLLPCRFTEPATASARALVDTSLGFVRGPVLVPLQFVDLHEQ
jgi:hypothetical protein